jgi:hypothetical protein
MKWIKWLQASTYRIYSLVFLLMLISSLFLYPAARSGTANWIWPLLGIFIFANLVLLIIK